MATTTIYASSQGYINSTNTVYATMRAGTTSTAYNSSTSAGQWKTGPNYTGTEAFTRFDLTAIPLGSTINSVVLSVTPLVSSVPSAFTVYAASIADYGTLDVTDWRNAAALAALSPLASFSPINGSTSAVDLTNVGTTLQTLVGSNLSGDIHLIFWSSRQEAGTVPTGYEYVQLSYTGTGKPRLTIDYTPPFTDYDETANSETVVDVDTYGTAVHKIAENVTNASRTQVLAQTYGNINHTIRENPSTTRVDVLAQTYGTAVLKITQHLPVNTLTVQTYGTDYEAMKEHTNRVDVLAQTYGTIGLSVADSAGSVQIMSQTYGSVSHLINEHTNIVTVLVNVTGFSGITETGNPIVLLTQTYGTDRADYKELLYPNVVLVSTTGIGNHTASELAGLSTIIAQTYGSVIHQMVEDTVIQTVLAQVYGIDSGLFLESSGSTVDVNVETYGVAGMFSLEHSGPIVVDISTLGTDISSMLEYLNNVTVVVETLGFTTETEAEGVVTVLVQTFGSDGFDLSFPVRYRVANLHTQNPYAVSLRVRR